MGRHMRLLLWLLLSLVGHCGGETNLGPRPDAALVRSSGLRRRRGVTLINSPNGTPHGTRLLARGADVVVINSNDVQLINERDGSFGVALVASFDAPRCTVGALSGSVVVCGSHGRNVVESVDVARGSLAARFTATADGHRGVFDLVRQADGLWIATADDALERLPVGPDGAPDGSQRRVIARGSFRTLVGDGGTRLAAWDAVTGRVSLYEGATLVREVTVDGPLLGGRWRGGALFAALGSAGVARIDPGSDAVAWRLRPPAVVTSVDLDDATMLVGATTGAFAFDRRAGEDRPFGFVPAEYGVLDVALRDGRALVLDWRSVSEFELDPAGEATVPDTARGYAVSSDRPLLVPARNVGRVALTIGATTIEPGGFARFSVSAARNNGQGVPIGDTGASVNVVRVASSGQPRLGELWPFDPERFGSSLLLVMESTCALQYPLWKELLYRAHHPTPGDPVMVLGLVDAPDVTQRWNDVWRLPGRSWSQLVDAPPGFNFARDLSLNLALGGPDTDGIYELDASGRLLRADNQWRGRHPLPPTQ